MYQKYKRNVMFAQLFVENLSLNFPVTSRTCHNFIVL